MPSAALSLFVLLELLVLAASQDPIQPKDLFALREKGLDTLVTLKDFVSRRGLAPPGTKSDLVTLASQVNLVETALRNQVLNMAVIGDALTSRGLPIGPGDIDEQFRRLATVVTNEYTIADWLLHNSNTNTSAVTSTVLPLVAANVRTAMLAMGFSNAFVSSLTYPDLVSTFSKAILNAYTIRRAVRDPSMTVTRSSAVQLLQGRGIPVPDTEPTASVLSRAAAAADSMSLEGLGGACSIVSRDSVCGSNGNPLVMPRATRDSLIAQWSFNNEGMLDESGNNNHPVITVPFGPGRAGVGSSAQLDGMSTLQIPDSPTMPQGDFSISLWLYLTADSTGNWRTLVHKGSQDRERTPTIMLEPQSRGLDVFVSTTHPPANETGERVWSTSFVPLQQWTHIALVVQGHDMRLYMNGRLDAEAVTVGDIVYNTGPMYIGNDPWRVGGGVSCYIDDFRIFSRVLEPNEIHAEGAGAGSVSGMDHVTLGCVNCTIDTCFASCKGIPALSASSSTPSEAALKNRHVCSTQEFVSGAFAAARARGWVSQRSHVWHTAADPTARDAIDFGPAFRMCVCCDSPSPDPRLTP